MFNHTKRQEPQTFLSLTKKLNTEKMQKLTIRRVIKLVYHLSLCELKELTLYNNVTTAIISYTKNNKLIENLWLCIADNNITYTRN